MNEAKQNLAAAVRDARTGLGLSQEKLAEILNIDSRTIRGIEAGRGNPKFEKLYPLVTYLKIPADKIFDPAYKEETPNLQKLLALQKDCTEQEAADLIPMIRYLLGLLRKEHSLLHPQQPSKSKNHHLCTVLKVQRHLLVSSNRRLYF